MIAHRGARIANGVEGCALAASRRASVPHSLVYLGNDVLPSSIIEGTHAMPRDHELLHGALETLILRALADGDDHGYGISRRIAAATAGAVEVEDGSLYPALYRLEAKGLIRGDWGLSEARKRARFYRLTDRGRRRLASQTAQWAAFAGGVSKYLLGDR